MIVAIIFVLDGCNVIYHNEFIQLQVPKDVGSYSFTWPWLWFFVLIDSHSIPCVIFLFMESTMFSFSTKVTPAWIFTTITSSYLILCRKYRCNKCYFNPDGFNLHFCLIIIDGTIIVTIFHHRREKSNLYIMCSIFLLITVSGKSTYL